MKILIACGGTAGHIFPGLALAQELKREDRDSKIVVVLSTHLRGKELLVKTVAYFENINIETVDSLPLPYQISFKYFIFILRLIWAALRSFYLVLKYRPEVVVGFGGHASVGPLVVAHLIGIPTLIHEQNVVPGRANQFLANVVDKIAITFDETKNFFNQVRSRDWIVKTGFPLRTHILDYQLDKNKTIKEKFTILVIGGSQGAHNLNEIVLSCLSLMTQEQLKHIQLVHLTGRKDFFYVKSRYKILTVNSQVYDFTEDIPSLYSQADLVISRSGAGTIFELASFGLPCILVPHIYGTRHQKENALYLERLGAAVVIDEKNQTVEDFKKKLLELITDEGMREGLSQRIKMIRTPEATRNLKAQVDLLCKNR